MGFFGTKQYVNDSHIPSSEDIKPFLDQEKFSTGHIILERDLGLVWTDWKLKGAIIKVLISVRLLRTPTQGPGSGKGLLVT